MTPTTIMLLMLIAPAAPDPAPDTAPALAPHTTPRHLAVTAFWENDSRSIKPNHPTDEHYTAGSLLLVSHNLHPDDAETTQALGYFAGQQIFTPVDLASTALIPDDRPYAGYLFAGAYWQRAIDRTLDHVQLELGTLGEHALGEDAQNWIHDLIDADRAHGWDHQVPNAFTAQLTWRRKWRLDLLEQDRWRVDLIPGVGIGVGTVKRQLEAGSTLRAGWRLPDDFGPTRIDDLAGGPHPGSPASPANLGPRKSSPSGLSAYVYARLGGRAVQHNATIDGSDFRGGPDTRVESAPFVGELEAGLTLRYQRDRWTIDLGYAQLFNSGEFRAQSGGDELATLRLAVGCHF